MSRPNFSNMSHNPISIPLICLWWRHSGYLGRRRLWRCFWQVAILTVMVGLSWTACFVLFSVRIAGFVDVFVQAPDSGWSLGLWFHPTVFVGLSSVGLSRHRMSNFLRSYSLHMVCGRIVFWLDCLLFFPSWLDICGVFFGHFKWGRLQVSSVAISVRTMLESWDIRCPTCWLYQNLVALVAAAIRDLMS